MAESARRWGADETTTVPRDAPRVLLVDPYVAREDPMERKFVELYPSIGLLTLAGFLRRHGVGVEIVDLTFDRDSRRVSSRMNSFRPHVVGIHTKSLTRRRSFLLARRAEEGGAVAVAGGPDAATEPAAYLDAGFRAVAFGEGEGTLRDIAFAARDGAPLPAIPGTVSRGANGRAVRGPGRPVIRDLDELPLPAWDLVDMESYLRAWEARTGERRAAVLTSRGCPFDCSWCSKPVFGRSFRQQSPARVLDELEALRRRFRVDYVRFCDDVFGIRRAWLEELLDGFRERGLDLKFECLARVDLLKIDLLERLRASGLQRVYVGVESGSQKMLDLMNRGTRLAQVERVATELRRAGIRQFWFLMLGYPGETLADIEATLGLFRRFSPEEYSVSIAVPVPGTRFFDAVRERLRRPSERTRRPRDGGRDLLFEAAYPESLYRWEQARFAWEAALGRARGRVPDRVLLALSRAADRMDRRLARPLLLGRSEPGVSASPPSSFPAAPPSSR